MNCPYNNPFLAKIKLFKKMRIPLPITLQIEVAQRHSINAQSLSSQAVCAEAYRRAWNCALRGGVELNFVKFTLLLHCNEP